MTPINENQERKINKLFVYILIGLAVAQVTIIVINSIYNG